jgi:hypothetical protein
LESIISSFKALTRLPNVASAIDGTHIQPAKCPNHEVTLATCNFFNMKKFHSIVLQWVCNVIFWNVCASQLKGVHDNKQFNVSNLYKDLRNHDILQEPIVEVSGMQCTPYLIIDFTYPIHIFAK